MRKLPKPKSLATKHRAVKKPNLKIDTRAANIEGHEYSPETEHLTVIFRGGRRYRYAGVKQDIADQFAAAQSKGSFLHSNILGKYEHTKI